MTDEQKDARRLDALQMLSTYSCTIETRPVINNIVSGDYIAVTNCPAAALAVITDSYRFASLVDGRVLIPLTVV